MAFVALVLAIKARKAYKGTLKHWLVPFAQDGKELIKQLEHLEFLAAAHNERQGAEGPEDGEDVVEDESDGVELRDMNRTPPRPPPNVGVG